jgi:hypothetical protein
VAEEARIEDADARIAALEAQNAALVEQVLRSSPSDDFVANNWHVLRWRDLFDPIPAGYVIRLV